MISSLDDAFISGKIIRVLAFDVLNEYRGTSSSSNLDIAESYP